MEFLTLKKNLKKDTTGLQTVKTALLGDNPTQLLSTAIKGYGIETGLNIDLYESEYNQIAPQILNISSELYEFDPRFVVIFESTQKLAKDFYKKDIHARLSFAESHLDKVSQYIEILSGQLKCNIIYFNFPETDDGIYGNYANKTHASFLYQIRKINLGLMELCTRYKNLFISDVALLTHRFGRNYTFSDSGYINTGMIHSLDFLPHVAKNILDIIKAIQGKIKKCLILDLDNTTWGGIIGDDGMEGIQIGSLGIGEAFTQLQTWARQLKERGIILAVCSKNEDNIAREPFENHPDMVLSMDDISVFVANWDNKADNIRHIQSILNIGFDTMVFIDDNPAERKIVRENIPEITVPDLPDDPAEYLPYLQSLNLFETASVTEEDGDRTRQYQEEAKRVTLKKTFVNEDEFLQSLQMKSAFGPFGKMEVPRIAQLTQRSNQFNLRTIRYTEEDITRITSDPDYYTFSFKLEDMFGDYGLVSIIILHKKNKEELFIDTWIMSCRVLKRGLEQLVLNELVSVAAKNGFKKVTGEYIPTPKNNMVKDHYKNLGFREEKNEFNWYMNVDDYIPVKHHIATKS